MLCNALLSIATLPLLISPPLASGRKPCSLVSSWPPSLVPAPANAEKRWHEDNKAASYNKRLITKGQRLKKTSIYVASTYRTRLSSLPLGFSQQLLYTLQRVLQDVHLEQQSLSLDLQPTQLLHHLVIAGLQLQLHHKHKSQISVGNFFLEERMPISGWARV